MICSTHAVLALNSMHPQDDIVDDKQQTPSSKIVYSKPTKAIVQLGQGTMKGVRYGNMLSIKLWNMQATAVSGCVSFVGKNAHHKTTEETTQAHLPPIYQVLLKS